MPIDDTAQWRQLMSGGIFPLIHSPLNLENIFFGIVIENGLSCSISIEELEKQKDCRQQVFEITFCSLPYIFVD